MDFKVPLTQYKKRVKSGWKRWMDPILVREAGWTKIEISSVGLTNFSMEHQWKAAANGGLVTTCTAPDSTLMAAIASKEVLFSLDLDMMKTVSWRETEAG